MLRPLAAFALVCGIFAAPAHAWGPEGHRTVGAIADQLIAPGNTREALNALLLPGETLASVSNWADCVKGMLCGPQTPDMLAYIDAHPHHHRFHFADVAMQSAHYQEGAVGTSADDIIHVLRQAIAVLQGGEEGQANPQHFTRREALLLIVHLVGDLHQPLHAGTVYLDKGGKQVLPATAAQVDGVKLFEPLGGSNLLLEEAALTRLAAGQIPARKAPAQAPVAADAAPRPQRSFHSYWDGPAVDYAIRLAGAVSGEQLARLIVASKPALGATAGEPQSWPLQWEDDSLQVLRKAYAGVTLGPASPRTSKRGETYYVWDVTLPPDYPATSAAVARAQLTHAGYRLAALLQAIWP